MNYTERPKALKGDSIRMETGCGHLYVTINKLDGKVIEVFASLGKCGGCSKGFLESLTKSITIGLRSGVELRRYHKILSGVQCNNSTYSEGIKVLSCSDAIAFIIKEYIDEETEQIPMPIIKQGGNE
jgi:ribonucleoside-diphosphate reductase alpha chain